MWTVSMRGRAVVGAVACDPGKEPADPGIDPTGPEYPTGTDDTPTDTDTTTGPTTDTTPATGTTEREQVYVSFAVGIGPDQDLVTVFSRDYASYYPEGYPNLFIVRLGEYGDPGYCEIIWEVRALTADGWYPGDFQRFTVTGDNLAIESDGCGPGRTWDGRPVAEVFGSVTHRFSLGPMDPQMSADIEAVGGYAPDYRWGSGHYESPDLPAPAQLLFLTLGNPIDADHVDQEENMPVEEMQTEDGLRAGIYDVDAIYPITAE